jgi:hypothetical protein
MDPNGSYTSEDYICDVSPLHEALRGTTAMPTLEEFQQFNSSKPISMNSMSTLAAPAGSTSPFLSDFTVSVPHYSAFFGE